MTSLPNGETSDVSSEAEGGQGEEQSEMPDSKEKDAASSQSETTLDLQRSIIEDIRFVLIMSPFTIPCATPIADLYFLLATLFFSLTGRVSLVSVWS